jgi:hypothetical protein
MVILVLVQGDFTLDTLGLPTLDLQIPVPNEESSVIAVTPGAFADGSALIAMQNGEECLPQSCAQRRGAAQLQQLLKYESLH